MSDVQHFQDCDDLALGRLVRSAPDGAVFGLLWEVANAGALTDYRQGCQCASLRASAAATYQGKLRKAAAAKGGQ